MSLSQDLKASFGLTLHGGNQHQWYLHQGPGTLLPLKSSRTTQSPLQTQGLQPGGTPATRMPTPRSSVQSPTQTLSCSEGKHFTLHYIQGNTLYAQQQTPGAACDLMGLCTKIFRICVHPNSRSVSLLRSF